MASNDKPFALICGGEVNYLKVPAGIRGEFENLYQVAYLPYVGSCDKPEVLRKWLRDHLKRHRRGPAVAVCFDDAFDVTIKAHLFIAKYSFHKVLRDIIMYLRICSFDGLLWLC